MRGYLNDETKEIELLNQIEAERLGLPDYEYDVGYDGKLYLKGYAPEKTQAVKEQEIRSIRNSYLVQYVDPEQRILVWNDLSEEEKQLYKDYRTYLLDYTLITDWFENEPLTFEEWKAKCQI